VQPPGIRFERIAERIDRTRQWLAAHAADPGGGCDFVAVLAGGAIVGFTAPFVEARRRHGSGTQPMDVAC